MIQDKMAKADQERIKALLKETITLLCKNGLTYSSEFSVEALIGITLDKEDVFLVNIKETIAHPNAEKESDSEGEVEERGRRPSHSSSSTPRRDTSNPPTPQRDSRDAGSPAQTPRSFSRQLAERKRAASQDNSNTSLPNITESFGWDGASPAKRSRDYKDEITDVVVIKEESGSEDDKDSCMISSGPPQLNQGSMGQDFRLDQSQLIPVPGNVLPGCSAWSTMPGTQGAALSLQGPPPPGMGVQGQPLNLLGGEPPNTSMSWNLAAPTSSHRPTSLRQSQSASDHLVLLARKVLLMKGGFVSVRTASRHVSNSSEEVSQAIGAMTTTRGSQWYVGEPRLLAGASRIFYKCPPQLISNTALSKYNISLEEYQVHYNMDPKPTSSAPVNWDRYMERVWQNSPFVDWYNTHHRPPPSDNQSTENQTLDRHATEKDTYSDKPDTENETEHDICVPDHKQEPSIDPQSQQSEGSQSDF